jgi:hypothetical protein
MKQILSEILIRERKAPSQIEKLESLFKQPVDLTLQRFQEGQIKLRLSFCDLSYEHQILFSFDIIQHLQASYETSCEKSKFFRFIGRLISS